MEILDAYDLTGSYRDAAELAGCSHNTVKRYVDARAAADTPPARSERRSQVIDPYVAKVEEWVDRSKGKVRADHVHAKLVWLGYTGSERTTRRAVADARAAFRVGNRRVHRPWVTEPGMWLQYDYGDGPLVDGVKTVLFVAWVAWSRFRVVLPLRDKTLPSVFAALDVTFRRIGGVPTYVLTDNEKTVTSEHIAGIPVRNPQLVEFARHYAVTVHTCVPADPASKGGTESSVKLAKADLVPTDANLREAYASFADLQEACEAFCELVNSRPHRVTRRAPVDMLAEERLRLHPGRGVPVHGRVRYHPGGPGEHADGGVRVGPVLRPARPVRADGVGSGPRPRPGRAGRDHPRRRRRAGRGRPPHAGHPRHPEARRHPLPRQPRGGPGADPAGEERQ